jgi:hypothetical protein
MDNPEIQVFFAYLTGEITLVSTLQGSPELK